MLRHDDMKAIPTAAKAANFLAGLRAMEVTEAAAQIAFVGAAVGNPNIASTPDELFPRASRFHYKALSVSIGPDI